jgi:hypothetical protein
MAKGARKAPTGTSRGKGAKADELVECFYCGGLVHDWNWKCPHCGKVFGSGKRAIAIFIVVILIAAIIGSYPFWRPVPAEEPHPLTIIRVTPVDGNTTAYLGAHPSVEFDQNHPFDVAKIDREACENAFSFTPAINGTLFWSGFGDYENFMTYMPSKMGDNLWLFDNWLQPNTTYTLTVSTDCKDIAGNRLSEDWTTTFMTEAEYRERPGGGG